MSIQSAMYAGMSGLYTNGENMSVIGNNIANVNTVGFKEGRAVFSDMLSTSLGNQGQVGSGEQIQAVQNVYSQGSFDTTTSSTDLAIQGNGMFVLSDPSGTGQYFSRAGAFTFNSNQILTNPSGYEVMGYGITNGASNGVLAPINLTDYQTMAPQATANVGIVSNLDSTAATPTMTWDPSQANFNPNEASNFSTSATIYNNQGTATSLTVYFTNTGNNNWQVNTYDGTNYTAAGAGIPVTFNTDGSLASVNGVSGGTTLTTNGVTLNLAGTTQYDSASTVTSQTQDGYAAGSLTTTTVDSNGYVNATYSNGQEVKIAQVAVAEFANPDGLNNLGNSLSSATTASGAALISSSNTSTNQVLCDSLEESNVDMANELVQLITTQRAYTANSKTITTSDEMMQDTLSLIR